MVRRRVLVLAFGVWAGFTRPAMPITGWRAAGRLPGGDNHDALPRGCATTLLGKGFDVWDRAVVTNWGGGRIVPGAVRHRAGRGWAG